MLKAIPYILFNGNCAEAMTFYHQCLGGELQITRAGDSPMKSQFSEKIHDKVINSWLTSGNIEISASDWFNPDYQPKQGNTVCIYLTGPYDEKLYEYFEKLSEGADPERILKLHELPFGLYGSLKDKFGISWMFTGRK